MPQVGSRTPWGIADQVETLANGIVFASTPSHGGYWVPAALLPKIPKKYQEYAEKWSGSPQWYEEDCAWACVVVTFPEHFKATYKDHEGVEHSLLELAQETVKRYIDN